MTNMLVEYIDHMGTDLSIANSAKASFAKVDTEFKPKEHTRLINYLARGLSQADYDELVKSVADCTNVEWVQEQMEQYRHTPSHFSPFCHATVSLRLKAPIAIHAQFMKHTVGFSHNSTSRRYVSDTPEFFVPTFRHAPTGNIKQGSGAEVKLAFTRKGDRYNQADLQRLYSKHVEDCLSFYDFLTDKDGVDIAPEQARFVLPQGVMTEWVTTGSLYAWARLYNLRSDSHAQKEIQELAHMIGDIIQPLFPVSWNALTLNHKE